MFCLVKNANRLLSIMVAIFAFLYIARCSIDDAPVEKEPADNLNTNVPVQYNMDEFVYLPEYITLPRDVGRVKHIAYYDGKAYFTATVNEEYSEGDIEFTATVSNIYSISLDGNELSELSEYAPPSAMPADAMYDVQIGQMITDTDGNLWVTERWVYFRFNLPADFDAENDDPWEYHEIIDFNYMVRMLDASTGAELLRINLDDINLQQRTPFVDTLAVDSLHNVYLGIMDSRGDEASVYVLDSTSKVTFQRNFKCQDIRLIHTPDDTIYSATVTYESIPGGVAIKQLQLTDISKGILGDSSVIPNDTWSDIESGGNMRFLQGCDGMDMLIKNSNGLYGYLN